MAHLYWHSCTVAACWWIDSKNPSDGGNMGGPGGMVPASRFPKHFQHGNSPQNRHKIMPAKIAHWCLPFDSSLLSCSHNFEYPTDQDIKQVYTQSISGCSTVYFSRMQVSVQQLSNHPIYGAKPHTGAFPTPETGPQKMVVTSSLLALPYQHPLGRHP